MITIEHTDTYGGESNYSWVKKYHFISDGTAINDRQTMRMAKAACGITGIRCRVERFGEMIAIYPRNICHVVFIGWDDEDRAKYHGARIDRYGNTYESANV